MSDKLYRRSLEGLCTTSVETIVASSVKGIFISSVEVRTFETPLEAIESGTSGEARTGTSENTVSQVSLTLLSQVQANLHP